MKRSPGGHNLHARKKAKDDYQAQRARHRERLRRKNESDGFALIEMLSPELVDKADDPTATDIEYGTPGYITEWYCEPPAMLVKFWVFKQTWNEDYTVRRIYGWKP